MMVSMSFKRAALTSLLLLTGSPAVSQDLRLRAVLNKELYYESEPIYLLLELTNGSRDTAWVAPHEMAYQNMVVTIVRDDGIRVPKHGLIADGVVARGWRGIPIAPGEHAYQTTVIQDWWGEDPVRGSRLFRRRLGPGRYELRATFDAYRGLPIPPLHIEAPPVRFAIRSATPSEALMIRQVDSIRRLAWDPATRAQAAHALIKWVEARAAVAPADEFL